MINENDTVFVTGGTGFTGRYLLRKLARLNCRVRALVRSKNRIGDLAALDIEWIQGNVYDQSIIEEALSGVTVVFHLAAAFREPGIANRVYHDVHVEGTRYLAQAASRQRDFRHFVHISTVGVHGHIDRPPAAEDAPLKPGDIYQRTKLEAEQWLAQYASVQQLPFTIIRPAMIYGPEDRRLLKVFKLAKLPVVPIIGYGQGLMHLIHVEDLTDFMIHVVDLPAAINETVICGNQNSLSFKDVIQIIADALQRKCRFVRIPATPVFILAHICEKLAKMVRVEPVLFPRRVAFFTNDRCFCTEKMHKQMHFKPRYSSEEGIRQLVTWYRSQRWI